MIDIIICLAIGFLLGYFLLKKIPYSIGLIIATLAGALFGWQILGSLPPFQTSLNYLLSGNPQLQLIWDTTHDIAMLTSAAQNGMYILIALDAFACLIGYWLAHYVRKHRFAKIST